MAFTVGMKVVCVDDSNTSLVRVGLVYTVREVWPEFLCLDGVRGHGISDGMYSCRFRPLVSRKTNIDVFTAMLNPSPVTVDAMKIADVAKEIAR